MTQQRKFSEVLTEFLDARDDLLHVYVHQPQCIGAKESRMTEISKQLDALVTPAITVSYQPAPNNVGFTIQPQSFRKKHD